MSSFFRRTFTGIGIVGFSIGAVLLGPYSFFFFCLLTCLLGLWEFYRLLQITNNRIRSVAGVLLSASLLLTVFLFTVLQQDWKILLLNVPLISFIFCTVLFIVSENPFQSLGIVFLGQVYITLPFVLLSVIGFVPDRAAFNQHIVLGYFFLLWSNDTGAYLSGSLLGRTPLAPVISPKKTWEGSAGGVLLTAATVYMLSKSFRDLLLTDWIVLGIIVIVMGTLGDLVKSVMKRSLRVKDSGTILPGHGGILDRFDSLIGSVPFVYSYLSLIATG